MTKRRGLTVCMTFLVVACSPTDAPTVLSTIAGDRSMAPHLASGPDEELVMSWLERDDNLASLKFSELIRGEWSAAQTVASGDNWFVNAADFPSVIRLSDDLMAAHWLVKSGDATYAYDVMLSVSSDAGKSWSAPFSPHSDGTQTEHGFVSLYADHEALGVLWLDGRETFDGRPMTLRSAVIGQRQQISGEQLVDERICDCCQTDVAIASSGPIAVYRDRSAEEIRDIYVSRKIDGVWSSGVAVGDDGWRIAGCPVNGPAIAARDEQVAVAWFTAADETPRIQVARSSDSGQSFRQVLRLGDGQAIGRVGLLLLEDGGILLSWLRRREDGQADVVVSVIDAANRHVKTLPVATAAAGSLSGVPQIARQGDLIVFAWTGKQDERRQVMTRAINLDELRR